MFRYFFIVFLFAGISVFAESEHNSAVSIHFGFFQPDIDNESGLNTSPYKDIFGKKGHRFGFDYSLEILSDEYLGTFSLLGGVEYFSVSGFGKYRDNPNEKSEDKTVLTLLPVNTALVYNLDQFQYLFDFPFVFYAELGVEYSFWWITDGVGDTVEFDEGKSYGGKKGWYYSLGIKFLLDFFDSDSALNLDNQYGINSSYIFAEYMSSKVDDFGKEGFRLGGNYWRFGISLIF